MPRTPSEALGQGGLSDSDRAWHVREGVAGRGVLPGHGEAGMRYQWPGPARAGPYRISPGRAGGKKSEWCKAGW